MRGELEHQVLVNKIPVLGICVGMQILGNSSEEGSRTGLGWIKGKVKRFDTTLIPFHTKLPHMGWNTITPVKKCYLLNSFNENDRFYFLHSYYFECEDQTDVAAETDFGNKFSSAINYKNIYGIQFHPEKSHSNGVRLLNNFSNI
jgi:glutamine amidotransferase